MEPTTHHIPVTRTAHYYTLGTAGPKTKRFWLACHGYGQLAQNFIRKFDIIAGEEDYVVAPEGLSRFYWNGLSGDVVASWMTKADRLDEIKDYSAMLTTIFQTQLALLPDDVEIILFGFSQGCATQVRWLMQVKPRFDHLWLWAGRFPEDIDYSDALDYLNAKPIHSFIGDADQLIKPHHIKFYRQLIKQAGIRMEEHQFAGDHRVVRQALIGFCQTLIPSFQHTAT
ncbi:MAG: phospholipase [Bacteroidota bacterium]